MVERGQVSRSVRPLFAAELIGRAGAIVGCCPPAHKRHENYEERPEPLRSVARPPLTSYRGSAATLPNATKLATLAECRDVAAGSVPGVSVATGGLTVQPNDIAEVLNRPLSQELLARDLTRLAYVATDGTPRNIPIAFTWNGSQVVMCTSKNAPKLVSLRKNPSVALTIDTEVHLPKILLIRGRAELDFVDGIPDEFLKATSTYAMTPEQRVEWEAEVRSLYRDGMVRIVVTPSWAKLIDFETTLPSAVEELARQRDERQRA